MALFSNECKVRKKKKKNVNDFLLRKELSINIKQNFFDVIQPLSMLHSSIIVSVLLAKKTMPKSSEVSS